MAPYGGKSRQTVTSSSSIHWLAPATMGAGLLMGILAATGHHVFYAHLAGTEVPVDNDQFFGYHISPQQINIAIGTALAYFGKVCLGLAISSAYMQAFWSAMKRPQMHSQLGDIDNVFAGLEDILAFLRTVWQSYPVPMILGLFAWLIPVTSVIAPATLSVESTRVDPPPSDLLHVPNVAFTSLNYVGDMLLREIWTLGVLDLDAEYYRPAMEVLNIMEAVARQGAILPITPPAPNSSWTLDFYGPSFKCDPIEGPDRRLVERNIGTWAHKWDCALAPAYLAWIQDSSLPTIRLPFRKSSSSVLGFHAGYYEAQNMQLNIAAIPPFMNTSRSEEVDPSLPTCVVDNNATASDPLGIGVNDGVTTFLQCRPFNASYRAMFHFESGSQRVSLDIDRKENVRPPASGLAITEDGSCIRWDDSPRNSPCLSDPEFLRPLSYRSVIHAFLQQLIGRISLIDLNSHIGRVSGVLQTSLVNTKELGFLRLPYRHHPQLTLQSWLREQHYKPRTQGWTHTTNQVLNKSLANALEDMFHNFTISLMSSAALQPNLTSIYAPPKTNVTFHRYHTIYTYSATKLWVAYGVAIGTTICAVSIGLMTIFVNGESYSSNFSTIFRVARAAAMDVDMQPSDGSGADPLPEHLKQARVCFNLTRGAEDKVEESDNKAKPFDIPRDPRLITKDTQLPESHASTCSLHASNRLLGIQHQPLAQSHGSPAASSAEPHFDPVTGPDH